MLLPHRDPCIGDDDIGACDRLVFVAVDRNIGTGSLCRADELRIGIIALGTADPDIELHQARGFDDAVKHVVAVTEPGNFKSRKRLAMFDECEQIGDDLARMREIGETVDHRDVGTGGHFLDLCMIVGPDHDRVGHAGKDPVVSRHGFAAPQLHRAAVHDDAGAAELADRDVKGHAGPRAALFKNHCQHMIGQRPVGVGFALGPPGARRLAVDRVCDHRGNCVAPGIGKVEKMPGHDSGA